MKLPLAEILLPFKFRLWMFDGVISLSFKGHFAMLLIVIKNVKY